MARPRTCQGRHACEARSYANKTTFDRRARHDHHESPRVPQAGRRIWRGEFVSLIGHSGCRKSTLLSLIAGLTDVISGSLTLEGDTIAKRGADRGMVFQHYSLLPWLSIYDNVAQAVEAVFRDHRPMKQAEQRARIERLLRAVRLWDHRLKKQGQVSDGQR